MKATTKVSSSHGPCCHDEVKLSCLSRAGLVDEGDRLSRMDARLRGAGTREQFFRQHICRCHQTGRPRSALFARCLVTPRRRWRSHPRGPEQDTKTPWGTRSSHSETPAWPITLADGTGTRTLAKRISRKPFSGEGDAFRTGYGVESQGLRAEFFAVG